MKLIPIICLAFGFSHLSFSAAKKQQLKRKSDAIETTVKSKQGKASKSSNSSLLESSMLTKAKNTKRLRAANLSLKLLPQPL